MDGILPLNKDRGMTSNDAVFKCRRLFRTRKVGHSGTLDPNVDGVLPICIGHATKVVSYLMESGKVYTGEVTLGFSTETEDLDGKIVEEYFLTKPFSDELIKEKMQQLCGDIIQIPPMYSAVKVNGRRLYDYARKGEEVERPKRKIHVESFELIGSSAFDKENGVQKLRFKVACGKGTYVRTLATDLGKKLGVPAVMSDLTRLESGSFKLDEAYTLAQVEEIRDQGKISHLVIPVEQVLGEYPKLMCTQAGDRLLQNGNPLIQELVNENVKEGWVRMYGSTGNFVGIYQWDQGKQRYFPVKMFI